MALKQKFTWSKVWITAQDYLLITVGAILLAVAIDMFLAPNHIISLGFTGLGMLANFLWNWPIGMVTLALNVPVLLAGLKWGGGLRFILRTIYAVAVMTLAIDWLAPVLTPVQGDPLIYILFGGVVNGLGAGLIFRGQGTAGGTDVISQLLNRYRGIPFGQVYTLVNAAVLLIIAVIVGLEPALYALIVVFVSGRVLDAVQEGAGYARTVFIIPTRLEAVRAAVIEHIGRGVTQLPAEGGFTHAPRPILFVVVSRTQVTPLKRIIAEIDPEAFVVVTDAREVLGKGFHPVVTTP